MSHIKVLLENSERLDRTAYPDGDIPTREVPSSGGVDFLAFVNDPCAFNPMVALKMGLKEARRGQS